ncbi:MAG: aldose 1-epimerase family protein [Defluviitaleaceae bacterium]|nr:aldose 1-epimerase family protein [Defluviitaleaceae bacterium]
MLHFLQSDEFSVTISEYGAELCSFLSKKTKMEYLWQKNPKFWDRQAPVLFPFVGRLKDAQYSYNGKTYPMPIHGFAPTTHFTTSGSTMDNTIVFSCTNTPETRKIYPFSFELNVIFTLKWNVLQTVYHVVNKTSGAMYFSLGSHEGFICPRSPGETFSNYFLEFDHDNTYKALTVTPDGFMSEPYTVLEDDRRLYLDYKMFDNNSVVLHNLPSNKVILASQSSKPKIVIEYDDAPNLVLWSQPNAPYICIEPWHGLPDFEKDQSPIDITKKQGIICLQQGETFAWQHNISIYE